MWYMFCTIALPKKIFFGYRFSTHAPKRVKPSEQYLKKSIYTTTILGTDEILLHQFTNILLILVPRYLSSKR